jgi:predicted amino acid racemase
MYPRLIIDREKILDNARSLQQKGRERGVEITPVVKALAAQRDLIMDIAALGFERLGCSNLRHIKTYSSAKAEKWLLRMPMFAEIEQLVSLTDGALVSAAETIRRLSRAAESQNREYQIILMAEMGDLREGCELQELLSLAALSKILPNIRLSGIGTNLSCFGNILPDEENMAQLVMWADAVSEHIGQSLPLISGGNSSSLRMLEQGTLPPAVNDLRLGEALLLGMLPCYDQPLPWLQQQTFIIEAEIVELKEKPSVPWGESGSCDSFGGLAPSWQDKGRRRRALLALGKQDLYINGLQPTDSGVELLGGSSNYLVCDISDSDEEYGGGDAIAFICDYAAMSRAMDSPDIAKIYRDQLK